LENFACLLKDALPADALGGPVEIWFQDEARVGQKGTHAYIWAPVGSRPLMVRDNRHDSAYLFGAICPDRAIGAALVMPEVNAEAMGHHLEAIAAQVAPGAHAGLICDGAGWHQTGGRLRETRHRTRCLAEYLPSSELMSPRLGIVNPVRWETTKPRRCVAQHQFPNQGTCGGLTLVT